MLSGRAQAAPWSSQPRPTSASSTSRSASDPTAPRPSPRRLRLPACSDRSIGSSPPGNRWPGRAPRRAAFPGTEEPTRTQATAKWPRALHRRRDAEKFNRLRAVTDHIVRHETLIAHATQHESVGIRKVIFRPAQPGLRIVLHVDAEIGPPHPDALRPALNHVHETVVFFATEVAETPGVVRPANSAIVTGTGF
jgi:hypothetical protein